jgi:hypothetical protein
MRFANDVRHSGSAGSGRGDADWNDAKLFVCDCLEARGDCAILGAKLVIEDVRGVVRKQQLVPGARRHVGDGEEIVAERDEVGGRSAEEVPERLDVLAIGLHGRGEGIEREAVAVDEDGGVIGEEAREEGTRDTLEELPRHRATEWIGGRGGREDCGDHGHSGRNVSE